jgi:hypothetical protein
MKNESRRSFVKKSAFTAASVSFFGEGLALNVDNSSYRPVYYLWETKYEFVEGSATIFLPPGATALQALNEFLDGTTADVVAWEQWWNNALFPLVGLVKETKFIKKVYKPVPRHIHSANQVGVDNISHHPQTVDANGNEAWVILLDGSDVVIRYTNRTPPPPEGQ